MDKDLLDTKESTLELQGTKTEQKQWSKRIKDRIDDLKPDRSERSIVYRKRHDFYTGNQGEYSNITGIVKDTKQKRGHTNQVTNYAGKTVVKAAMGMANNPPKQTVAPGNAIDDIEVVRAQAVEEFIDSVMDDRINRFWKSSYRRGCFIQVEYGDVAIKTYIEDGKIKICLHENMESLMVGWNGEAGKFDFVIVENLLTPNLIFEQYGIKVDEKVLKEKATTDKKAQGSWNHDEVWGTNSASPGSAELPSGKTKLTKVKVVEYDSDNVYAILIEDELVQLIFKDDENFPPSPWSIADIDYLIDPQIELNENDNRSSDHLRVGNVQRYVAYNINDFDPESIKTSSGQVIMINDPDGKARFEPLQTNINNFPDDQYHTRKMNSIHDMGLPKVNYGASGADSGRSKAIDYQSSVDLTNFKRDAWELALSDICDKIQIFGNFLLGDQVDWFSNEEGEFVTRKIEFDWNDVLPISQSDKIVNVANKVNMIGLSIKTALKELGYRNVDAEIAQIKKELEDPNLMILRSKMWQLSGGLLAAQNQAATMAMSNGSEMGAPAGTAPESSPTPQLSGESGEASSPMASGVGQTAISSANGVIAQAQQNIAAGGN
jgi:hypothetical protein